MSAAGSRGRSRSTARAGAHRRLRPARVVSVPAPVVAPEAAAVAPRAAAPAAVAAPAGRPGHQAVAAAAWAAAPGRGRAHPWRHTERTPRASISSRFLLDTRVDGNAAAAATAATTGRGRRILDVARIVAGGLDRVATVGV